MGPYTFRACEAFLAMHPELTGHRFTRTELLQALRHAVREPHWLFSLGEDTRRIGRGSLGAVNSNEVAKQLSPMPPPSLVGRVAREFGKLADEGKILRLRASRWHGTLMWTLPGMELAPQIAKHYTLEAIHAR
jgi:hypothetical protein